GGGKDDGGGARLAGAAVGVQGAGAAGREQRVPARIPAALGDVHARGARHVLVDDVVDAPGDLGQRKADARRKTLERGPSAIHIDADLASGEVLRVEISPGESDVRDG